METRSEAATLLKMKANKKLVQEHVQQKTGKFVLLRDLSNIRRSSNTPVENQLEATLSDLERQPGATVGVVVNDQHSLVGIFYQDEVMKRVFSYYPEFLMVDSTYKLNDLRMPLYVFLVVDGNGESEIVGTFLAADETEHTIREMVKVFKAQNPDHVKVQTVMTDKDFVERSVFRDELPQASMVICLFHVLRTFRREITCDRMGLRPNQRDVCLDLFQQIVYSPSPEEYEDRVSRLRSTGYDKVIEYYENNWAGIKHEFVECFKSECLTLGNRTNNRIESINEKIKTVCCR